MLVRGFVQVVSLYYASWSSPSKAMYDVMVKLAAVLNPNHVIFCKVDIDESKVTSLLSLYLILGFQDS